MIGRSFVIVKLDIRGNVMSIMATFDDEGKAQEWADNANEWYGPDHPLTPLVVMGGVLIEPPLFPTPSRLAAQKKLAK